MELDEAMSSLGKFGRWQMFTYTLVCLSVTVSGCWHMMVIMFTGAEPDHHCKVPEGQWKNMTIPLITERGKERYSRCDRYMNYTVDNTTVKCDHGWYYDPVFDSTIVTEWDLVCDKNYLVETSQSVFSFGVMVGAVGFTTLADRIGRKPVHLACQWGMVGIGLALAFSPNYITFVVLRFLLGAIREGAGLVGIVMACELFPAAQRTFAGTALELFWAGSWMVLALLAYLIRNWRHLQLAVTLPPILTISYIWLLPESVPWLVANGRYDRAQAILKKAAKINKVAEPILGRVGEEMQTYVNENKTDEGKSDCKHHNTSGSEGQPLNRECSDNNDKDTSNYQINLKQTGPTPLTPKRNKVFGYFVQLFRPGKKSVTHHEEVIELQNQYSCLDIFRSRTMFLNTFIMCSLWFASGIIYFGLSLSTSNLAGDMYVNFAISGAVEAPAYLMTVFVLQKYGRRWPLCIFHMIAGVVLFINIFIPEETESGINLTALIVTLTMIGKFAMTAAFGTVVLYAPEIYPTNLRNMGFGMASVWGRIGGMIAPFAAYIDKAQGSHPLEVVFRYRNTQLQDKIVPWVSGLCFTVVAILTGAMVLMLPETLNRALPETIEEIEGWKEEEKQARKAKRASKLQGDLCHNDETVSIRDKHSDKASSQEASV